MNSRRAQVWLWWWLPFWVARALLPVGFMAQAQHGSFNVVLCSAGVLQAKQDNKPASEAPAQQHGSQAGASCPFAHAGGVALPTAADASGVPFIAATSIAVAFVPLPFVSRPWRAHRVRGPPDFSLR